VLAAIRGRPAALSEQAIATVLAATEHDVGFDAVTDDQRQVMLTTLRHSQFPKLESAGLVEFDDHGRVSLTDAPALADDGVVSAALDLPGDPASKDATFEALASEMRQTAIELLRADGETTVSQLATELARDTEASETDVTVALHHRHLPKLVDLGVVSMGPDGEQVTFEGLPVSVENWDDQRDGTAETAFSSPLH
jgi:DNA-binding transcriptional ArsR family regulator